MIGRADLAKDPTLADNAGRVKRTEELEQVISKWTSQQDLEQILKMLEEAQVPSGKIYSIRDICEDIHYQARDMIQEFKLSNGENILLPGIVPKLSESPGDTKWLGPKLGEHTEDVLTQLGYDEAQLSILKKDGVI